MKKLHFYMGIAWLTFVYPWSVRAQQLWFSPGDDLNVAGVVTHPDFSKLFVIKADAGIDLDYVVMDEPLYFGHHYSGTSACQFSIAEVAKGVAESVARIRSYHANAKFILVEPEQSLPDGIRDDHAWIDTAKENAEAFSSAITVRPDHTMIQT